MGSKHLRQLLDEDQEPFVLKSYIDEKRCQLRKAVSKPNLQITKRKPISGNSTFPNSFCKNACFSSSFLDSPEIKKSPLFYFSSPAKSPCRRNPDTLFIHIPSRTAALLLEAALRIQKHSGSQKPKSHRSLGFGFFGSILSKLSHRKRNRKREIMEDRVRVSVKDILRWDSSDLRREVCEEREEPGDPARLVMELERKIVPDFGISCSCDSRRTDLETCCTSRAGDSKETEFTFEDTERDEFSSRETEICSSPFRFVLLSSQSPIRPLPGSESPATSPTRRKMQVLKNDQVVQQDVLTKGYEEEEEKEHSSPVSVLDPQFEDDDEDEGHEDDDEHDQDNDCGLELERSFAIVQRTKQKLLHKLRRFEQLAELDPIELEKRMLEEEEEEEDGESDDINYDNYDDDDLRSSVEDTSALFVREVLSCSTTCNLQRVPSDLERLILDLMNEEEGAAAGFEDKELLAKKLCKRLDSWKDANLKTIDMMVEFDLRREGQEWGKNQEHVQDISSSIELGIFRFLVEELSEELVHDSSGFVV